MIPEKTILMTMSEWEAQRRQQRHEKILERALGGFMFGFGAVLGSFAGMGVIFMLITHV